ncbi:hypothetical protein GYMLUDRAFT_65125 [Collybiopsis luxurians FD-317 M1]|uniref:Unplaced genomic scaffold GYMLUscaffold_136, whole genome shotgun sequence n=1 Tax=Collybiopsis luxurians FD-317 M1 TaxID=944289 RepID=A0A0D0BZH4_9AGAR|nr:hypothetical protein GYMLUDRAFT_65125 [Collybiopsis luxurians FD-317 M1]
MAKGVTEVPYEFDEFKHEIDTRSGYLTTSPVLDELDLQEFIDEECMFKFKHDKLYEDKGMKMSVFHKTLLPKEGGQFKKENPYSLKHCSEAGNEMDNLLPLIKECILIWKWTRSQIGLKKR